ncbi:alpha/beta hydrolase [Alteromonas sp. ASW11-130]|uniref:alpha/beta hydrolase n=1 Tax=Alteromonas sp. ASW11-130 TaxID=3015775 RepID=UPI0022418DC3|nr:alpha/beta hydrolase-fold protein [Alteromonas sp. ASW11-130]MCW8092191.1 alpha/beta hydrolase-fold protein [Alteromonas sp. ASW11-130]
MLWNKAWLLAGVSFFLFACQFAEYENQNSTPTPMSVNESTRSYNVNLVAHRFFFPEGEPRKVWIYLPPDYAKSEKQYPVLYMHDGQNLFDNSTSYMGEWRVDEILNQLAAEGWNVPIVVAINHGNENRLNELSPWQQEKYPDVAGKFYADFIVKQVKPYIDNAFRTHSGVAHTSVMGSSMGGLMSHYMLIAYPDIFGKAAIFSPSFWFSQQAFSFAENNPVPSTHRLLFVAGSEEHKQVTNNTKAMVSLHEAQQHPQTNLYSAIVDGGKHNETFWQEQFAFALKWLNIVGQKND